MSQLNHLTDKELVEYYELYSKLMEDGKRYEKVKKDGCDLKFCYHLVRLLNECEQILATGDLDLMLNNEHLKAIRRGDITEKDIRSWAAEKELQLEKLCAESKLPEKPDGAKIKQLLVNCLEQHYGNLENCVRVPDAHENALREIKKVLDKAGI